MNLDKLYSAEYPFKHWEISNCLDANALDEISYSNLPNGNRAYDGTRAADHTGQGMDGKLRLFLDLQNCSSFPYLTKVIKELQTKEIYQKIGNLINKDLFSTKNVGAYYFTGGWHLKGIYSLLIGFIFAASTIWNYELRFLQSFSWIIGAFFSSLTYYLLVSK